MPMLQPELPAPISMIMATPALLSVVLERFVMFSMLKMAPRDFQDTANIGKVQGVATLRYLERKVRKLGAKTVK